MTPLCVNPDDMGHTPDCPHNRWTVRGDLFACDGCGVRAERIWKGWPTRPTARCPRCACPVQGLEQHQPVCTGPTTQPTEAS